MKTCTCYTALRASLLACVFLSAHALPTSASYPKNGAATVYILPRASPGPLVIPPRHLVVRADSDGIDQGYEADASDSSDSSDDSDASMASVESLNAQEKPGAKKRKASQEPEGDSQPKKVRKKKQASGVSRATKSTGQQRKLQSPAVKRPPTSSKKILGQRPNSKVKRPKAGGKKVALGSASRKANVRKGRKGKKNVK